MDKKILLLVLIVIPLIIFCYPPQEEYFSYDTPLESTRADSAHGFDVTKYELFLDVDTDSHYIDGTVVAEVTATDIINEISYNLVSLTVDEVTVNGETAPYDHSGGILTIELGEISTGEAFTTSVSYHGYPGSSPGYGGGMFWNSNYVFTVSDPDASRYWWPCYDHPWDKAVVDLHITLRDDWLVAANGIREGIDSNGDNTNTTHWIGSHPMTTYLACFHAADFVEFEQSCTLPDGEELLIQQFCPSNQLANAQEDFSNVPWMIEYFSEIYGQYPFEKFGQCVVPMSIFAGMEHQTMVTLANYLITGNHTYETVFAHELAHHWFGDCVAFLDFPHVWLSEGFAVYSEALWTQEWQGYEAMQNYVASDIQGYYLSWSGGSNYTIYNPTFYNYFTPPVYQKAASVLHMLRLQAGDDAFFEILQTYFATYQHGNAVTSEFQEIVESVTGEDYQQFFEQWIFGSGIPRYEYAWFFNPYDAIPKLRTYVKTTSTSPTEYYSKVPFMVEYENGSTDSVLVDAAPEAVMTESLLNGALIEEVNFDPNSWLLDRGVSHHALDITGAYPFEGGAALYWSNVWDDLEVDGYKLLRSDSENGVFLPVSGDLINSRMYIDTGLEVGNTYYYKVQAVIDENFESEASQIFEVTISSWPLDQGILVIDESANGTGMPGNPSDEQVDDFYASITGMETTEYDYAQEGIIDVDTIKHYSTVIWHDADLSQKNISDNEAVLGSYVYAGGNLLISGWKTANYLSEEFLEQFSGNPLVNMANGQEFTGAESTIYPELQIQADKLPSIFNGRLPYVCTFPDGNEEIYSYQGIAGSGYTGEAVAARADFSGKSLILGFPLYYCCEEEVTGFMTALLDEFEGNSNDHDLIIAPDINLKVYPNPFYGNDRASLRINYNLGDSSQGELSMYNVKGQQTGKIDLRQKEGHYNWQIDDKLSCGVYFIVLQSSGRQQIQKTLILK